MKTLDLFIRLDLRLNLETAVSEGVARAESADKGTIRRVVEMFHYGRVVPVPIFDDDETINTLRLICHISVNESTFVQLKSTQISRPMSKGSGASFRSVELIRILRSYTPG